MKLRLILLPFTWIYHLITFCRNKCFDLGIFKSFTPKIPVICIGNLSTGGTGKSPLVKYIAKSLFENNEIAILSRGYKRNTKGFQLVSKTDIASFCGDEPLMYAHSLPPKVHIAVCENRPKGIEQLVDNFPDIQCIILDDAFQHRQVTATFTILVTEYHRPYFKDFVLPAGNLREAKNGAKRADILVVSKCPNQLTESMKADWVEKTHFTNENVFFSNIQYRDWEAKGKKTERIQSIFLVTGIGNPMPLIKSLKYTYDVTHIRFPDHHSYTREDLLKIHRKFGTFVQAGAILLTTEKDWMRLGSVLLVEELEQYPWYVVPIEITIDREREFKKRLYECIRAI
jgi:tetraacyldisaccharide 4'-kinase